MTRWIENTDKHGNTWKLILEKRKGTTNRFELSFHINSKKFVLSRISTKTQADDMWELMAKTVKEGTPMKREADPKPESKKDKTNE